MKQIAIIFICFLAVAAKAQSKTEVENTVRDYIDGFYYGDTLKIHNSISPDVIKHGYDREKGKDVYLKDTMTYQQCIDYAAKIHQRGVSKNVEKYPKKIEVFDVLDKTASAKVTAWWGTDYVLLTKINGKWLITHVLWQAFPPAQEAK